MGIYPHIFNKMRYLTELGDKKYVKDYVVNLSSKRGQNLLNQTNKSETGAYKTVWKRTIQIH